MASSLSDGPMSSPNLADELESAFQDCMSLLTSQEHFNINDSEETKTGIEHSIQQFLDIAKQMEAFFLNKRLVFTHRKPDQAIKESYSQEIQEMKSEIERKDELIKRHHERLIQWQNLLRGTQSTAGPSQQPMHPNIQPTIPTPQPHPQMSGSHPSSQSLSHGNVGHYPLQQSHSMPNSQSFVMPPPPQVPPQYGPGPGPNPLAYLEQTTSNIGMPERRQ